MSCPKSVAVMISSLSGYAGKNRYSSNRLCMTHANTSRSRGDPLRHFSRWATSPSTVVPFPWYSCVKCPLASSSTSGANCCCASPATPLPTPAAALACSRRMLAASSGGSWLPCSTPKTVPSTSAVKGGFSPGWARSLRKSRHPSANTSPLEVSISLSHCSRAKSSLHAPRRASSSAKGRGPIDRAIDSAFTSSCFRSSRLRASPEGSWALSSAMEYTVASGFAAHTRRSTARLSGREERNTGEAKCRTFSWVWLHAARKQTMPTASS
mmetsp:Transcript_12422/g.35052  ORF Transcript_12422/g.35052 Transcript_12422/m.35052 type:complete len:268 (+) Transcript_12422:277-1080(+)